MCIGPNARLNPMIITQKWSFPRPSLSFRPNTFGHQ